MSEETPRLFQTNINNVLEGLRPHMSLSITLPTWSRHPELHHQQPQQQAQIIQPQQQIASSSQNDNQNHHIIDIEQNGSNQPVAVSESLNTPPSPDDSLDETAATILRHSPETQALLNVILRYLPFILIAIAKAVYDYIGGIVIIFGLLFSFGHANFVLKREIAKQGRKSALALAGVACNITVSVIFVYYIYGIKKNGLYLSIFYVTPTLSAKEILWLIAVSDLVLKLFTILIKMTLASLPGRILPYATRGKHFLFLEASSQLYRAITPVRPWLCYLLDAYQGPERFVGVLLSAAYMITKFRDLILRFLFFRRACGKLIERSSWGLSPSQQELKAAGSECPICHDTFTNPVRLQCRHIFCEGCVAIWLDRERTCPLCRASIVDDPSYRDGSTTYFLQLF